MNPLRRTFILSATFILCTTVSISPAAASMLPPASVSANIHAQGSETVKRVEEALHRLRLPVGTVDGIFDGETQKGICAWRGLTGKKESRLKLSPGEREELLTTLAPAGGALTVPRKFIAGMNISKTCQVLFWVKKNNGGEKNLRGVFKVSTGASGHTTPSGIYRVDRQINGWHESTGYPGAMMYRPKYFNGGIAMHGSITDAYVLPYPASHGCVRMLHKDIDKLWRAGVSHGTAVHVYGEWGR